PGPDAKLVGGAVRDELLGLESKDADFLVPGVDTDALRMKLERHGRVEDLVVADRLVGVRLHPRDKQVRTLAPAGIEFAPPRKEVSTGPGRHDFEIVADPSLSVEDDMRRRDFTVNAMARHLADGTIVDPLGGRADLERRLLRAARPEAALRVARATGVLVELIPEFGPAHYLADHIFGVVQASADAGYDLPVRLATLFHDLGKPVDRDPLGHARVSAEIARA